MNDAPRQPLHTPELEDRIYAVLGNIYDPEIGIDIVSLGLVYGVAVDDTGLCVIDMTLTSPYCPLGDVLELQATSVCNSLPEIRETSINFVWTPPWDPKTMASDEAKLELGIY